ncbi:MAG: bifunctional metallophosphatase/5'-nucleotidase, partial [Alistipes sp.]|nr:bifunctional metallophosphatase/5'-nucleotidase [Alistipes sp.]
MKRSLRTLLVVLTAVAASCAPRERTVVVLSTNAMHARIQRFPRLAAAVAACRDTVPTLLIDAGDRWTGDAYVDKAPTPGMPMIRLMNRLGYDVATLGNHEFDFGQAFLGRMID